MIGIIRKRLSRGRRREKKRGERGVHDNEEEDLIGVSVTLDY